MTPIHVPAGLFISFEGIDGAGKSSHIEALAHAIEASGRRVTRTREPGGTPLAEALREWVLNRPMDALTEALLVFAARRDHVQNVIRPALKNGDVVLCDRFTDATFAYQGGGRGFDWGTLQALERMVQGEGEALLQPDATLWFQVDPVVAAQRLAGARLPDRFEAQPVAFFEQVHAAYARRMAEGPERFILIDGEQPMDAVRAQVLAIAHDKGWLR